MRAMTLILLDELETILNETNHVKHTLNVVCGTLWDLLNPRGTENNEVKALHLKDSDSQIASNCDSDINVSNSLEESLESVTKLIALGKLVRGATKIEKNADHSVSETFGKHFANKESLQKVTKLPDKSTNRSCNIVRKGNSLPRNLGTKKIYSSQFSKDRNDEDRVHKKGQIYQIVSCAQNHKCSLTLPNFVRTMKMPEDLRRILKLYYHYETCKGNVNLSNKSPKSGPPVFFERFYNLVKLKLNCDLKANIKQTERYVKYLDISDGISRDTSNKNIGGNCQIMEYKSLEDLNKYEEKMQHLTELKIKMRLLSLLNDQLPQLPV